MCRKCPERKRPVFLTPPSTMIGVSIGSANQEWAGEQLPGMEGGVLHSSLPGGWQQICVSKERRWTAIEHQTSIHLASLKREVKVACVCRLLSPDLVPYLEGQLLLTSQCTAGIWKYLSLVPETLWVCTHQGFCRVSAFESL